MTLQQMLEFAPVAFLIVVIPGPSVLFTISRALTAGRRDALLNVGGNAFGVYLQVVCVAFGLGLVVARSSEAFTVLKLLGAVYLMYLGVQAFRGRRKLADALGTAATPKRPLRVMRDGVVVGFCNPKSLVLFAATISQFVNQPSGGVPGQILLLGLEIPLIALLSDSVWALAAGKARDWFARSPRRLSVVGGASGLTMIGLGAGLAFSGRAD